MTREKIIDGLKVVRTIHNGNYAPQIDEAIKLLEKENILDKIRDEISKAWYTHPNNRYEEGLKDQALKDMKIIDKHKAESKPESNDKESD